MKIEIKNIAESHWSEVSRIYKEGISTGMATFETRVPTWEVWNKSHIATCRLGAFNNSELVGWAALSLVSQREVYKGVAEVSLYVDSNFCNKGIGSELLEKLIHESEIAGFWTLQSGIFPQNRASVNLHRKLGFREIGYREKVAKRDGKWIDNILMERRSKLVGLD